MARCACIDIGSNTTRLLVVEAGDGCPREILAERSFTRLASASAQQGAIGEEKLAEIARVVTRQAQLADKLGAVELRIVATSAVRAAANGSELQAAVRAACGIEPEILSGEEEARLAFRGAIGMLAGAPAGLLAVVDVGGGSTEIAVGSVQDGVTWSVSLPLGSGTVTDGDLPADPPTPEELARLAEKLTTVFAAVRAPPVATAYAVGGSAGSLLLLVGPVLTREAMAHALTALVARPAADVAPALGLHPERARLLPAGLLLLAAAARALDAPLRIAGGGLREGVVMEQLERLDLTRRSRQGDPPSPDA